jgi:hypothetical protein
MIQLLATRYNTLIASLLLIVFECSFIPAHTAAGKKYYTNYLGSFKKQGRANGVNSFPANNLPKNNSQKSVATPDSASKNFIGGPTQPEMSSFKSVGTDNMVNLFTGDFSYNIPLLDVGGYPVNIFYSGGITPEQEASWVGLGWNINPGTISRNMRGVPDDFDGTDELKQTQVMKDNVTWGFTAGYDLELVGIKDFAGFTGSVGASLDLSFNNYLGPALGLGLKGTTNFKIANIGGSEKSGSIGIGGGISANINSRSGVTLSPSLSLSASAFQKEQESFGFGTRLGTSYNSRSGIKALQLSEQMSYNYSKTPVGPNTYTGNDHSMGLTSSSTISFSKPSYIPSIRMPLINEAYSGHFQLGNALFGVYGDAEIEAYKQVSRVAQKEQKKPLVGYMYYQKATNNPNAVMDFTRFNDNEVTPHTPVISAPQYAYDVFSVQGEGTGGTIRAYRDDMGYVRDNTTRSVDKSFSGGVDVGIPGHYGANFNVIKTPTVVSEWNRGNKLRNTTGFKSTNNLEEAVYFRNPGEASVINNNQFEPIGGTDLVRFKLGASNIMPTIEPYLEQFSKSGNGNVSNTTDIKTPSSYERKKRTQVISFLTAKEAEDIGLDQNEELKLDKIRSYRPGVLDNQNNLVYDRINRYYSNDPVTDTWRKPHHISQVNVTEANGRRYVYGIPVYNVVQKDFTFSVASSATADDLVTFNSGEEQEGSLLLKDKTKDGYVQITETPAYAHSFLLTGLLSPDYVDVTGNGITEDDLGDAVKFNYTRYNDHQWRTPLSKTDYVANFNDGNRSERKDDKGVVSWGKRESWYMHSIESKTMIALFTLEDRKDGKGVSGEQVKLDVNDQSQKRLQKIDLYSKADLKKNGLAGAKPIKTVWFVYSYRLCAHTLDNNEQPETVNNVDVNANKGKLTLDGIYFTFNGKNRTNKNKYVFSYTNNDGTGNPDYIPNASDRWGNYKSKQDNPGQLKNADHPYSVQTKNVDGKNKADINAGAWSLKKILLPSGGQIEVEYESDDYAFVQNRRAATMMQVVGIGKDQNTKTSNLYRYESGWKDNFYVFIDVPDASFITGTDAVDKLKKSYLQDFDQLAFKLAVNMPKNMEYVNCYAYIDYDDPVPCGRFDDKTIWIKLKQARNGVSPLTLSVLDYLRERLPGQAFRGYDVSESTGLKQIADILGGMGDALKSAFKDPITFLRSQAKAQTIILDRSFVRLTDPDGHKFGGGQRVKSVVLKDNWQPMSQQYTSTYGQKYEYTTTEVFNGTERTISSGVASYEPSIGGEENPFLSIVQVLDKVPLGPASYGAIEMPVLDAFFPAPLVGYSKVTVRSIKEGTIEAGKKSRSGIGKQVTEFYTAKDFPVLYSHTTLDPTVDKIYHQSSLLNFFYKYTIDTRALSQGFLVETNDMHGKPKSQSSYAEGDEKTRINYTENFYRNTGVNGLDEKFDFVYAAKGGEVQQGNMGIDVELMTDTREFSVKSTSFEVQGQLDLFPIFFGLPWLPFIWPVSGNSENTYRAVTTTKVVNYHAMVDKVVVIDKGSMVTTQNQVYDAETGDVVVNRTNNEFDKPVYSVNYPAYWAYSGMGLAYKNIDVAYSGVTFTDGRITSGMASEQIKESFESGDEIYVLDPGPSQPITTSLNGTVSLSCNGSGNVGITFTFSNPTPANLIIQVGQITHYLSANIYKGTGYDIYTLPPGVTPDNYYAYPNETFNFSIPQGTTTINFPPMIYSPSGVGGNAAWSCDYEGVNQWHTTDLYLKAYSLDNLYQPQFTTSQSYTVHNILNGNIDCTIPYSDVNEKLIWALNKNKNAGSLTDVNPDFIFIDKKGKPYSRSGVTFRIVRSGKRNMLNAPVATATAMVDPIVTENGVRKLKISSASKIITASAIEYKEKWQVENDVFKRLRLVVDSQTCVTSEVEDCNGYLEKSINPYRKGLLGNFRVHYSKVYYGNRAQTDPLVATNISENGFLGSDFQAYWSFNNANNLVPVLHNNWVWNTQSTRFNLRGLELETKDANEIYTSAQYGYSKSVPVAIATNSRYEEMFAEGFEDYNYNDLLNNSAYNNCASKHIEFSDLVEASVIDANAAGFNAHTGKYVLKVDGNISTKNISVKSPSALDYNLTLLPDATKTLIDQGSNFTISNVASADPFDGTYNTVINGSNPSAYVQIHPADIITDAYRFHYYKSHWDFYIQITEPKTYSFSMDLSSTYNNYEVSVYSHQNSSVVRIYDLQGRVVDEHSLQQAQFEPQAANYTVFLCPGIYKVESDMIELFSASTPASNSMPENIYRWSCNVPSAIYKSLSSQNGCAFTKPIATEDNMLHSNFTIPSAGKMLFSAWIKQNCGANTCNNKVTIDFGNGAPVDFAPSGPVIEGWQRIEGQFTVPNNV